MTICLRCLSRSSQIRWVSTKRKIIPELNINIHKSIESEEMSPKKHPGVLRLLPPEVPEKLLNGIKYITRDKPVKSLLKEGVAFERYLKGRHQPMEASEHEEHLRRIRKTAKKIYNINEEDDIEYDDEKKSYKAPVNNKIIELYKKYTYNWKPVNYDAYLSSVYLVTRTAPDYAVLCRVFQEIFTRDKTFEPKSLFDFGSGVGTVMWAAKHFWNDSLKEFFCVDSSSVMNDISQALLQGGELKKIPEKGVYYRQFLPSQSSAYDIVVTAYTLFELPSKKARLETILNLWNKTRKYLVIVEHGSNAGFKLISEAREFILFSSRTQSGKLPKAHVLGPCPHDQQCPRLVKDETPCNFEVVYNVLPIDNKARLKKERFSYVILKKGGRDDITSSQWPRIVRPTIKRSGHTICQLCTAEGKLEEVIFSRAKQGKILYQCAQSSRWGDLIPVKLEEKEFVIDDKLDTSNIDMAEEEENEEGELTEKKCNIDDDSKMR